MGRVTYLHGGSDYAVVEPIGPDESDLSVPLYAFKLAEAVRLIKRDRREYCGTACEDIQLLKYGPRHTLIVVYDNVDEQPTLLVYEHEDGEEH